MWWQAPFIKHTSPLLRIHQYSSLAALAFRTGHPYWGWRFTGLALHYTQDLALHNLELDASYPAWNDRYPRDVVARESYAAGARIAEAIVAAMPAEFVSNPAFDFGVKEAGIDLGGAMAKADAGKRAELDRQLGELLGHFGAHSRNTIRGILKMAAQP